MGGNRARVVLRVLSRAGQICGALAILALFVVGTAGPAAAQATPSAPPGPPSVKYFVVPHADNPDDVVRDSYLGSEGFRVLRFWNNDVLRNTQGVLEMIVSALEAVPSPGALRAPPSPQGERGKKASHCRRGKPLTIDHAFFEIQRRGPRARRCSD